MRVEKLIRSLTEIRARCAALHAAGEEVGNELPRNRLVVLRELLVELDRLQGSGQTADPFAQGYVMAIRDIVHAYIDVIAHAQDIDCVARTFIEDGYIPIFRSFEARTALTRNDLTSSLVLNHEDVGTKLELLSTIGLLDAMYASADGVCEPMYRLSGLGERVWMRMKEIQGEHP